MIAWLRAFHRDYWACLPGRTRRHAAALAWQSRQWWQPERDNATAPRHPSRHA